MTAAESPAEVSVRPRGVAVDGIPMSGVLAHVENPRATLVAVHGGATTSAYFDCPGQPHLSLLRTGAAMGFTVLAIDRPGFGASALYADQFDDTARRIDLTFAAVDRMLGTGDHRLFVMAHSNGCELALRMAAHPRGADLLGMELSGTGLRQTGRAREILAGATRTSPPVGLRELLWEPAHTYPDGVDRAVRINGGPVSPGYEGQLIRHWRNDFPVVAAQVTVPVRFTVAEHERVWESGPDAHAEILSLFSSSPRVLGFHQPGGGHNLSLSHIAPEYHRSVLSFVDRCLAEPNPGSTE